MGQLRRKRSSDKKTVFLAAFEMCASVSAAALSVPVDRALHYRWLREDPEYPARFKASRAIAVKRARENATADATRLYSFRKARVLLAMHLEHEKRIAKLEAELKRLKVALKN